MVAVFILFHYRYGYWLYANQMPCPYHGIDFLFSGIGDVVKFRFVLRTMIARCALVKS